jgi:hypothetical protein
LGRAAAASQQLRWRAEQVRAKLHTSLLSHHAEAAKDSVNGGVAVPESPAAGSAGTANAFAASAAAATASNGALTVLPLHNLGKVVAEHVQAPLLGRVNVPRSHAAGAVAASMQQVVVSPAQFQAVHNAFFAAA